MGVFAGSPSTFLRPVIETSYRDETYPVQVPVTDPKTGRVTMRTEQRTRKVPVQTTRYVPETRSADPSQTPLTHDTKVYQIATELRGTPVTDANQEEVESKSEELRQLLETEFQKKHDAQAAEIADTEKRITDLKALHQQRGDNASQIVQRRIDQLLGKSNPLDWETSGPTPQYNTPFQVPAGCPNSMRMPISRPSRAIRVPIESAVPQRQCSVSVEITYPGVGFP